MYMAKELPATYVTAGNDAGSAPKACAAVTVAIVVNALDWPANHHVIGVVTAADPVAAVDVFDSIARQYTLPGDRV